jgi:hypothetical protein
VAVEERQLLDPMRWLVGRIQINRDAAGAAAQPYLVPLNHTRGQLAADPIERPGVHAIFEPRDRSAGSNATQDPGFSP